MTRDSQGSQEQYDSFDDEFEDVCFECGGEGYVVADCFEDTCCCLEPEIEHGLIRCPNCGGRP